MLENADINGAIGILRKINVVSDADFVVEAMVK